MSGVASLIADLCAAGVSAELVGRVAAALAQREPIIVRVADEQAERRRQRDRERKAHIRRNPQTSDDSADAAPPPKEAPHTPKEITPPSPSLRSGSFSEREHEEFLAWAWREIPKRRGDSPKPFRKALLKALREGVGVETIRAGIIAYAAAERTGDPQFRKGAAVWANAAGWEADYSQPSGQFARAGPPPPKRNVWLELELQERAEREGRGQDREIHERRDDADTIELAGDQYHFVG